MGRHRVSPQRDSGAYKCTRVMTPDKSECRVTMVDTDIDRLGTWVMTSDESECRVTVVDTDVGLLGISEGRKLSILISLID